ncbi:MAG: recombinase family protein [Clostridia bacterium]|nr:recombinase family protein [Clostridia bacterium]
MLYMPELNLTPEEVLDYLRKSRTDDPSMTVEEVLNQHENILDSWAEKHLGGKVPEENKYRELVSGETIADRPEMCAMLRRIESPKIKAIKCADVQRLSRGDLEDAGRLIKLLRHTNTLVIIPNVYGGQYVYDLRDEDSREKFERELKKGNEYLEYYKKIQAAGTLLSVSKGNYVGNVPPYGYKKISVMDGKRKCPTLAIKEDEAEVVRMMFDMYVNQNMGCHSICLKFDEMGIKPPKGKHWSPAAMTKMLENVHYLGKVKWNHRKTLTIVEDGEFKKTRPVAKVGEYLIYEGKHEAIISEELFNAAQDKKGRNARVTPNKKIRNPFAGLIWCKCGRALSLRTYKNPDGTERSVPRLLCDGQRYCKSGSCTFEEMVERVSLILEQCIKDFEIRLQNDEGNSVKLHANLIKRLEAKKKELEEKELAQWEAQADPNPENRMPQHIFKMLNEKLLKEKDEVQQALCKAYESMPEPVDYEERIATFSAALEALKDPGTDVAQKNKLLKDCIDRIEYSRAKPVRKKSQQVRYYDKEMKRTRYKSPLSTGGNWEAAPMELDVKLKV